MYYDIYIGNRPYILYVEDTQYDAFLHDDTDGVKIEELEWGAYAKLDIKYNQSTENLEVRIVALSPRGRYLIYDETPTLPPRLVVETNNGHGYGMYNHARQNYKRYWRFKKRGGYYKGRDLPNYSDYIPNTYVLNRSNYAQTFSFPIGNLIGRDGTIISDYNGGGLNRFVNNVFPPARAYYNIKFNLWGHGRYKKTASNKITIQGSDISYLKNQT